MAHQNGGVVPFHPRGKGQQVTFRKLLPGAAVHHGGGVGVPVVSVTGKMLEHRAHAAAVHGRNRRPHIVRGGGGVPAEGPVIHKISGIGGDISHRGEVHIDSVL